MRWMVLGFFIQERNCMNDEFSRRATDQNVSREGTNLMGHTHDNVPATKQKKLSRDHVESDSQRSIYSSRTDSLPAQIQYMNQVWTFDGRSWYDESNTHAPTGLIPTLAMYLRSTTKETAQTRIL